MKTRDDGVRVVKPPATKKIPLQDCLLPGWWPAALQGRKKDSFAFCCFTRHSKAPGPRPAAAGLEKCSEEAKRRWAEDDWAQAPYQYEESNFVRPASGQQLRRLTAAEEEGMPPD